MKIKSGFSQYAKAKIPLKHSKLTSSHPKLGKFLPHGFRVGDRVYYVSSYSTNIRCYGIVVEYKTDGSFPEYNQPHFVWAKWERTTGDNSLGYMPKNTVFRACT